MTSALIASDTSSSRCSRPATTSRGSRRCSRTSPRCRRTTTRGLTLLGVVLGNFDSRAKLDADVRAMLVSKFGEGAMFETVINRSVRHREATVYGRTIFEHAEGESCARAMPRPLLTRFWPGLSQQRRRRQPLRKEAANA